MSPDPSSSAVSPLWERREPMGVLDMSIVAKGDRSIAESYYHRDALRVLQPHYLDDSGQVYYTIVNPGGGYLGGDDYRISVSVGKDASLLLTSQSATKVYRTPDNYALQEMQITLAPGAVLEYLPDQLIMYEGATYAQHMTVEMDPTASLVVAEIVTPGWAPDGSTFTYDEVRLRTSVTVGDELAVVDNLLLRPGGGEFEEDTLFFFEDKSHLATLLILDARVDQDLLAEVRGVMNDFVTQAAKTEILQAATLIDGPGIAVRALGTYTEDLFHLVTAVADFLRVRWRGQPPLHLRKY